MVKEVLTRIKRAFFLVREELDEHLTSINENTEEIQSNYSHFSDLSNKLDLLAKRLERIELSLNIKSQKYDIKSLSPEETKVFLAFYTRVDSVSYEELSSILDMNKAEIHVYVCSLIEKGVPISKSFFGSSALMRMDQQFKDLQAKENVVNLSLASFC